MCITRRAADTLLHRIKGGEIVLCMICDDEKSEMEMMQSIVSDYAGEHPDLFLTIKCFSNPFDMLDEMDRSGAPDIALLDICMPGVLGTEVAREIQSKSEDATDIIFLTTSTEFAVEAFSLHVNDYLTKPYTKERLMDTLDRVIEKRRQRLYIPVPCGNEIRRIDLYLSLIHICPFPDTVAFHLKQRKGKFHPFLHAATVSGIV